MRKKILIVLLIIVAGGLFIFVDPNLFKGSSVHAAICPDNLDDQECLKYLDEQKKKLEKERKKINRDMKTERNVQSSLFGQIKSIDNEITSNELSIKEKEITIEINTLKIYEINKEKDATQTKVDTLLQEVSIVDQNISARIVDSYTLTLTPPWLLLLKGKGVSQIYESLQYSLIFRKEDKKLLRQLNDMRLEIDRKKTWLVQQQNEVEKKRVQMELENQSLIELRVQLDVKQTQKEALLAESKLRAKELKKQETQIHTQSGQINQELAAVALRLLREGQLGQGTAVKKGDIIGFQGHTGCSFGSHLHFGMSRNAYGANINPFSTGYLTGSTAYLSILGSGSARTPMNGALVTQGFHFGYNLDLVSSTDGHQGGNMYYKKKGQVKCPFYADSYLPGYFSLRGEGAPLYAVLGGTIYSSRVDQYGGHYVIIDHGGGLASYYWHLR